MFRAPAFSQGEELGGKGPPSATSPGGPEGAAGTPPSPPTPTGRKAGVAGGTCACLLPQDKRRAQAPAGTRPQRLPIPPRQRRGCSCCWPARGSGELGARLGLAGFKEPEISGFWGSPPPEWSRPLAWSLGQKVQSLKE